ncbi:bifunctional indole-3-glycerol-phosphate synthase TrpC/phosphoribosylanthranilate isomerase TrpF [Blochmannia endosymbiont of Camponotus sp. C-003]|uniref:bifunctional indole-3-glycerol-phosphate synthase TrpC/phosphoribosylanthranilate isomerase TrpF n=1 Tax=unclassified Candidatus Blochmanniella TaxID=711328 RepID=UPI002023C1A4|nr:MULTISPECIES: bifunctional indole-3-glycerol-phosphate synthase TrpC/phosphoribosylanthranilate isomerase TrpF [unclassified Candidatus Blochmannia]URJ23396.1 bifunctional indole-3-glycerol-phosphate synthase TrpC/phosphoribosylanthranilate isomerase TrpF [Blochmannia endosymbiont of Camponotus sp. C-003]URJ28869.1 bifunctional indole-3-glycerol-phosphate synthase TrpC/phosphoribosylanthranilate isomerase TrpF [Blochmannia endosymbiont of Camponotus sp. C-046]
MQYTILDKILSYKKIWIANQEKQHSLHILKTKTQLSNRDFYSAMSNNKRQTIFILECKKASPSKGIICNNFDPVKIAQTYKNYSSVISILTDDKYFHGNFDILHQVSDIVEQPILCKDFFISEWQIYFARLHKADAILLILSILDDTTYQKLVKIAHTLCMGVLTEISNADELKRAKYLGAKVIGINNRNLHDFSVDLNRTITLSKDIPNTITVISESGINNYCHIRKLRQYVNGFLIGTILMSQPNLNVAIKKLILGENKICGLTRVRDAYITYKSGAIYGGLIFVPTSSRCINIITAKRIVSHVQHLSYVGVFCNATISYVVNIANILKLAAVQLHGIENQDYINILRTQLPMQCRIWKSINMRHHNRPLSRYNILNVDRYLADNGGGSGKTFDWSLLSNMRLDKVILAGGLTINNCDKAARIGCIGLDFNSGVEIKPGIKNHRKLIKIFQIIKSY